MKKLFTFFLSLAVYTMYAQPNQIQVEDSATSSREAWRDTCFGLIDKSLGQIPSGYLLDYSLAAFETSRYDGIGTNDDTISHYGQYLSLYHIMQLSMVNSNTSVIAVNDLYISSRRYIRDSQKIPLLFLLQPYQKINSGALAASLFTLTADSLRLQDVQGRTSSPYDNYQLFIFTAGENFISQHANVVFSLPSEFWMMPGISTVTIDFNDGLGPRNIGKGNELSVYYASEGIKYIKASIATSNGTLRAKAAIQYRRPAFFSQPDIVWKMNTTPVFTSISSYLGAEPKGAGKMQEQELTACTDENVFNRVNCDIDPGAEVFIENGCDRIFDKPVIFVSGFDADGNMGMNELRRKFSSYQFSVELRSAGYDLVYVRLTKPLDFIENNAKVLEEVINRINITLQGDAKTGNYWF